MEKHEYEVMFRMEEDYWWYLGLRDLVWLYIGQFEKKQNTLKILDAGCGTGKFLETCGNYCAYGIEISEEAFKYLKRRKIKNVVRSSISHLPFNKGVFNLIISLDVLYHARVKKDEDVLIEMYRLLAGDGLIILNLPAFEFLRSEHDQAIHTKQRYTVKDIQNKLEQAGFTIEKITYRNTFLFPVAALVRLLKRVSLIKGAEARSDLRLLPPWLNKLLFLLLLIENRLLYYGVKFPFGLSVFCIAKKQNNRGLLTLPGS